MPEQPDWKPEGKCGDLVAYLQDEPCEVVLRVYPEGDRWDADAEAYGEAEASYVNLRVYVRIESAAFDAEECKRAALAARPVAEAALQALRGLDWLREANEREGDREALRVAVEALRQIEAGGTQSHGEAIALAREALGKVAP